MAYSDRGRLKVPYREIKLTLHAKQRASERLNINKDSEIQKLAHAAKYKGVKIRALTYDNHEDYGIPTDLYRYLKNHYAHYTNNDKSYYYKGYVYVFSGDGSRTLKTIVPCTQEDINEALAKLDKHKKVGE